MRVVVQRVSEASVEIDFKETREIGKGLVILLGIEEEDGRADAEWLCRKIPLMRIFPDEGGKMNLSVNDLDGDILLISQFTLHASTKKGNRPGFARAAHPSRAEPLYREFISLLASQVKGKVVTGEFGAHMNINLVNDGPVTIVMDTRDKDF